MAQLDRNEYVSRMSFVLAVLDSIEQIGRSYDLSDFNPSTLKVLAESATERLLELDMMLTPEAFTSPEPQTIKGGTH